MKKWLITAGILMAAGLVLFGVCLAIAGFDFANLGTRNMVTNTYTTEESFANIRVDAITADITFLPSEDGQVRVVSYEDAKISYSVYVENDTLVVSCRDNRKWYDHIGFHWETARVTVYVPAGEYGDLEINCTTGVVTVPEVFTFQNAALELTTGDACWKAGVHKELSVKCTTGSTKIENTLCETLCVKATTGDITLQGVQAAETMDITVSTGAVKLSRVDAGEIQIKATTGSVTGTLLSEKVFITKTTTGDISVPQTTTGGACRVTTTTGHIHLEIE